MALTRIAVGPDCSGGNCPSVHTTDDPTVLVVQGNVLTEGLRGEFSTPIPAGEDAVTIPTEVILRAAKLIEGR